LQSCDLSQVAKGAATVTNGAGVCSPLGGADNNVDSTTGTGLDEFENGLGAYYSIRYNVSAVTGDTIQAVSVLGRSENSYNAEAYSKVLGRFAIYLGSRPFNKDLDGQILCAENRESTAAPGWSKTFDCEQPTAGPFVTVVLLPDPSLVGLVAAKIPKDSRPGFLRCGGTCPAEGCDGTAAACRCGCDTDNPMRIVRADSPRFLVIAEMAACVGPA